jgi:hypothetical protein
MNLSGIRNLWLCIYIEHVELGGRMILNIEWNRLWWGGVGICVCYRCSFVFFEITKFGFTINGSKKHRSAKDVYKYLHITVHVRKADN